MALQTKTITANGSKGHHKFTLTINEESTNINNNTSSLSFTFVLSPIVKNYDWLYNSTVPVTYSISIGGNTYSGNIMQYDGVSTVTIHSNTLTIQHNTDGTKTISCGFSVSDIGKSFMPGACSASSTMTLTAVARKATIVSVPQFYDDQSPTVIYSNPAGNAVSSLEIGISADGSTMDIPYRAISKTGTSYTFNFTEAEKEVLYNTFLYKARSTNATFRLKTVIGSNTFTSDFISSIEMRNGEPVITAIDLRDTLEAAIALTGNNQTIIKGYNAVIGTITAEPRKGATIQNYKTTNGNEVKWANSNLFENTENPNFAFRVIDDRGFYTDVTRSLNIIDYYHPTCNLKTSVEMVGETTARITIEVSGFYFDGSFGAKNNVIAVNYQYKVDNGEYGSWTRIDNPTKADGKYTATATIDVDYRHTYTIKAAIQDWVNVNGVGSVEVPVNVVPVFDWSGEDFNFNVPVSINGVKIGYIVEEGTKDGWLYRKWDSGMCECWKTVTLNTTIGTAWGGLYTGNTKIARQTYPFVYKEKPKETATLTSGTYAAWLYADGNNGDGVNGAYGSAVYCVCRPTPTTANGDYYITIYVYGELQ